MKPDFLLLWHDLRKLFTHSLPFSYRDHQVIREMTWNCILNMVLTTFLSIKYGLINLNYCFEVTEITESYTYTILFKISVANLFCLYIKIISLSLKSLELSKIFIIYFKLFGQITSTYVSTFWSLSTSWD